MGSLPPPATPPLKVAADELSLLFASQRDNLDHFFSNLDLSSAAAFASLLAGATSANAVLFSGVGKSGFVAAKIAHTLASLGLLRSSFLSPVDALHGDLGALFPGDILVLLSKSGSSDELLALAPCARAKGAFLVGIVSVPDSPLAKACDMVVSLPLKREVCPFGLAPVTSASVQMLFGDTIVAAVMNARRMSSNQYAINHPAGKIGKTLIFRVKDLMKKENDLPLCKENDMIMDQLTELTSKGCGCLLVADNEKHIIGTFTDGDLRRTLKDSGPSIFNLTVGQMCNRHPRTITADAMAVEAMQKMESPPSPVQFLPVVDENNIVIGIITLHGLVSAGL